jgi:hypothetical protein
MRVLCIAQISRAVELRKKVLHSTVINVIINMIIQLTGFKCVSERRCQIPRLNMVGGR